MSEEDKKRDESQDVNTGGGAYVGGNVNTGGGDFVGRDKVGGDKISVGNVGEGSAVAVGRGARASVTSGLSGEEIGKLFASIFEQIEARAETSAEDKADLKAETQELQTEIARGDEADESFLQRRLRNIGRIAPDIMDVVLKTFANPALGVATVVRRVMARARGE